MFPKISTDKGNFFVIDEDRTRGTTENPEMSLVPLKEIDHVDMLPDMLEKLIYLSGQFLV